MDGLKLYIWESFTSFDGWSTMVLAHDVYEARFLLNNEGRVSDEVVSYANSHEPEVYDEPKAIVHYFGD